MMMRIWIAAALLLAACSTTSVKDTWRDPAFSGPPARQVLVVGVLKGDANRRVFEDSFSRALGAAGSRGIASYPIITDSTAGISEARLVAAMKQANADAVLVTRVLRVRRDVSVTPGFGHAGFYGRGYGGWYGGMMSAPDIDVYDVLTVESTLWNRNADKPIWSGTSEVTEPGSVAKATEDLSKALIARMKADGVI
jgi:hypothetical protein